jgi:glycosyltransferase involved in cell wall biosynthesis
MRVAFLITEDWFVRSHWQSLISSVVTSGNETLLLTNVSGPYGDLQATGACVIPVQLDRSGKNPLIEARTVMQISRALRTFRPDILHNIALKPVLYGALATRVASTPVVINGMGGLGSLFVDDLTTQRRILRRALVMALAAPRSSVIVENSDDRQELADLGIEKDKIHVIPGAGVDIDRFSYTSETPSPPINVRYFGRLLWQKGLQELHDAAKQLQTESTIVIEAYGSADAHNPSSIDLRTIKTWNEEGWMKCCGFTAQTKELLATSHIVVLPSYREGLPKSLLEAAASGRAIIAADVPGCRAVVKHGENGILVAARSSEKLAEAIRRLADDQPLRSAMGLVSRQRAEDEFSEKVVNGAMLTLYQELLSRATTSRDRHH